MNEEMAKQLDLVQREREKQVSIGYTNEYNKSVNKEEQMAKAASWIVQYDDENYDAELSEIVKPEGWDLTYWMRLCKKPYKDRVRIGAALLVAELERIE